MTIGVKVDPKVAEALLRDLRKQEEALAEADATRKAAMAMFRLASARYAAVRDAIQSQIGRSPYDTDVVKELWPDIEGTDEPAWEHPDFGRYQYIGKKVGDAVIDALINFGHPLI